MLKVLYIIAGDTSFDEMLFLDTFINQLPSKEIENCILAPALPLSHVVLQNRQVRIEQGTRETEHENWLALLEEFQPQVAILCDPAVLLSPEAEALSYFDLEWLEDLPCALSLFDFRANLLKTEDGALALKKYVLENSEPPASLDYDYLIKICPPHDYTPSQNPRLIHWKNQDIMPQLSIYAVKDETRQQLGVAKDSKVITLVFPVENLLMANQRGLNRHFSLVTDVLIHYLNQLSGQYHLYVVNMAPPDAETQFDNVKIRYLETLEMELLDSLLKASDLFITESLTYPSLIQSSLREIPSLCLGSSVGLDEKGELTHAFENLSPMLQLKLETLKAESPEHIFPYMSFPIPRYDEWPGRTLFHKRFFFYLMDLFNEAEMIETIRECLHGGPARDHFREELKSYLQNKLEGPRDAEQIIRKLSTAPPRYL
ncbi:hypothetical protein COW36_00025 [bacterium (Candidatus Blackallbacteria) CG17_big_fil_post_rev_8_21_14_2_50_48_46]|uniref:Uncharacterized protein n=1 Tax=bacterium (Candidatus Blackallbacteria) CG17_big_fil_post_rev_8_21_14_2_50_48_46 TaxID=2014261 RepID=A0A2M7GBS7_9BACT|nr:MAG: hypothetical protein COW64_07865 [bacterium (Candidatus Blackallbacteria) CG18_big_fil_WC_8_21_14_2_50_49_26]PIW19655.1 MAG: hypothetical protein COW36_00025 [bacterium (Candidatus Blackallbacteria) CG17_big_fil_post_rev_8_21_14_2_50_48_46]PIW44726.1 MAG: hypothetical protein COW20_22940 [bacterium (Candidatus Blackallbacteria) CG13_big_fil_rev_8_21_14_2_50_49_14]